MAATAGPRATPSRDEVLRWERLLEHTQSAPDRYAHRPSDAVRERMARTSPEFGFCGLPNVVHGAEEWARLASACGETPPAAPAGREGCDAPAGVESDGLAPQLSGFADAARSGRAPRGLWLLGEPGAVESAGVELARRVKGARWVDVAEFAAEIDGKNRFGPDGAQAAANEYAGCALLVLNRPEIAHVGPGAVEVAYPVMRSRRLRALPVVVASALGFKSAGDRLLTTCRTREQQDRAGALLSELSEVTGGPSGVVHLD